MRAAVFDPEVVDLQEGLGINPVRTCSNLMNSHRNPFHVRKLRLDVQQRKGRTEDEKSCPTPQTSSNVSPQERSFPALAAEGWHRRVEYPVPKVAFPYITDLSADLEHNFDLIIDSLPALPCEVKQRTVKLPPSPKMMTLVLGLEGTLVAPRTPTHAEGSSIPEPQLPRVRPHVREFLEVLSHNYEIIVACLLHGIRSSPRARRRTRPKSSSRSTRRSG